MTLLELDRVTKIYRRGGWFGRRARVEALSNVSLAVPEGGSVGLIGRSGAGKSTLGRIILGLERPDGGEVAYGGRSMRNFRRHDWRRFRREVQVVFQNALGSTDPRWQVFDIVAEPLRNYETLPRAVLRTRVEEILESVGLEAADAGKYPHQFSGGQLQRVCIGRALALRPRLIILDEAVSSLDMLIQAQILNLLRGLRSRTGVSYLFISHDIRVVAGFCDEIAVLHEGRITSRVSSLERIGDADDPVLRTLISSVLPPLPCSAPAGT